MFNLDLMSEATDTGRVILEKINSLQNVKSLRQSSPKMVCDSSLYGNIPYGADIDVDAIAAEILQEVREKESANA